LIDFSSQTRWNSLLELSSSPVEGIVLSNEVVDAMPVHCVRRQEGYLRELYVSTSGARFFGQWNGLSTELLGEYLKRMNVELTEGQVAEINLDALVWLGQVSAALRRGFVITIDYGDLVDHLYAPDRLEGTLRCFYRHTMNDRPFERVGEQDITADVNFSALMEYGKDVGLETVRLMRQADYLIRLGLLDRMERMIERGEQGFESIKARLALKNFFIPGGISDHFKVLVQKKSASKKS
jgi:SAM-dependent MidA family methyltransferase